MLEVLTPCWHIYLPMTHPADTRVYNMMNVQRMCGVWNGVLKGGTEAFPPKSSLPFSASHQFVDIPHSSVVLFPSSHWVSDGFWYDIVVCVIHAEGGLLVHARRNWRPFNVQRRDDQYICPLSIKQCDVAMTTVMTYAITVHCCDVGSVQPTSTSETAEALNQSQATETRPTCIHWCGEKHFRSAHSNCPRVFVYNEYTCISNPPAVDVPMAAETSLTEHRSVLSSGNRTHISGSHLQRLRLFTIQRTRHFAHRPRWNCSCNPTGGNRVSYPKRAPSAYPPESMYRPRRFHAHTLQSPSAVVNRRRQRPRAIINANSGGDRVNANKRAPEAEL